MSIKLKTEMELDYKFSAQDLFAWLFGAILALSTLNSYVLGAQIFGVFIFQMLVVFALFLSFFIDKYMQINIILISVFYITLYWFLRNYLIVGDFSKIFAVSDIVLSTNVIVMVLFSTVLGLLFVSMIYYRHKLLLYCSLVLLIYCILSSVFATIIYIDDTFPRYIVNYGSIADFAIIFFQFYAVKSIIFILIYSIIMMVSHSIHLKMIPNIKLMGRN